MLDLDPLLLESTPLSGSNLIEASAGTGKTYTIAALYLRLAVEEGVRVDQILVVTFTEAATQELAERIRARLREALLFLEDGVGDDPLYAELFSNKIDPELAKRRLGAALRNFDEAAIFTIHGFCRRLLSDHAFESGSPLDLELVTDLSHLKRRAVVDYYRHMVAGASPLYAAWLKTKKWVPDSFGSFLSFSTPTSRITFLPKVEPLETQELEARFLEQMRRATKVWESEKEAALTIVATDKALNRNRYRKGVEVKIEAAASEFFSGAISFGDNSILRKLSFSDLSSATKKGMAIEENPLFFQMDDLMASLDELTEAFEKNHVAHQIALARFVDERLEKEKNRAGIMGFDDLLSHVASALNGPSAKGFVARVRQRFSAALIDEFQDTDPQQYFIFEKIFGQGAEKTLFMIGDPKQAIYGFRGADIFAYLHAAGEAEKGYTLDVNYRSTDAMVGAVNTLFKEGTQPFLFEAIQFLPVESAGKADEAPLLVDGEPPSAMVIPRFEAGKKPLSRERAEAVCISLCAAEMVRLLRLGRQGRAFLGQEPLSEKDMAVIVRTNDQARDVKHALNALGVHAVLYSSGNIFDSLEAEEMARLIAACLKPWRLPLLKGALATSMVGLNALDIESLESEAGALDRWSLFVTELHALWHERGFMPMVRRLLSELDVLEHLMRQDGGERRVTNVQHLVGLLHRESSEKKVTPQGLLRWLERMMDPSSPRLEEHQLQLESDRNAVQIVTIHKSKGLEYPVVFLPFSFMGFRQVKESAMCHSAHGEVILDAGSDDFEEHKERAENEALAEELRLLYVALTRARCHLFMPWGPVNGWERSAMARVLHAPESHTAASLALKMKKITDDDVQARLVELEALAPHSFATFLEEKERDEDEISLSFQVEEKPLGQVRTLERTLPDSLVVTSFSGLLSAGKENREADRDTFSPRKIEEDIPAKGIFAFPKGAAPGTFMHTVFETVPFDADRDLCRGICEDLLVRNGFSAEEWGEPVTEMVMQVLHAPLGLDGDEKKTFTLSQIASEDRLHEMEFTFPLKCITAKALETELARWGYGAVSGEELVMEGLSFSPVKGYLKGFIDLIFQVNGRFAVLDWKSNHLGNCAERYTHETIGRTMNEHRYTLQFLLYTVAVRRHLMLKLGEAFDYDSHMAGALYLFVRGVDEKGHGVYFNRPEAGCIEALDRLLIDDEVKL